MSQNPSNGGLTPSQRSGCRTYFWTGAVFISLVTLLSFCAQPSEEEKSAKVAAGFHCLNYYSGAHAALEEAVKSSLRDPDSYEHVSTKVTPVSENGTHRIVMEYRAKNGFGGKVIEQVTGSYSNSTCELLEWHAM